MVLPGRPSSAVYGFGYKATTHAIDTETPIGRGRVLEFLRMFMVFARLHLVSGLVSYAPGPILGSVFPPYPFWLKSCNHSGSSRVLHRGASIAIAV